MKSALVTGGAGFIGFHLAKHLHKLGYVVTVIDDFSRGRKDIDLEEFLAKPNVKIVSADMTKTDFFTKLENRYDEIYHLAAVNGTKNFYDCPEKVLKVNILALMNLLEWIDPTNCGKFLFTSSSEAYAGTITEFGNSHDYIPTKEDIPLTINDVFNPRFSYGGSKLIGEILTINYMRSKQVPFSVIRYHNIYGPRMGFDHVIPEFCKRIYEKTDPFPIFGGDETRAFCYVLDGVEATVAVMNSDKTNSQIVHIGNSKEEIKISDMASLLLEINNYNVNIDIKNAPEGSVKRRCPNTDKLFALTGASARITLVEGLKLTNDWYMKTYAYVLKR
ncbi:nucleoside-diphosphate sugar epimerase [Campylobacterota bacterium]|nr:nucleoside-diphosphate sugar epimerase [Campylobacterota bacterium]